LRESKAVERLTILFYTLYLGSKNSAFDPNKRTNILIFFKIAKYFTKKILLVNLKIHQKNTFVVLHVALAIFKLKKVRSPKSVFLVSNWSNSYKRRRQNLLTIKEWAVKTKI
jgi:hypothetical protein